MSKILVVDDEPLIVEMIEDNLKSEDYTVTKAYSGEEALSLVESDPPDLILLDLMLPGMDGYEVCRQLQRDARFNHIPIIMLTAKSAVTDRVTGYERGADDYITKPFEADELLIRVRAQIRYRYHEDRSALTGLPGNEAVKVAIEERTSSPDEEWSIIYVDIEHFTAYNEAYSFTDGDELIRQAGTCLKQAVHEQGQPEDFVGHIGGDDFVILTTPDYSQQITDRATALFNVVAPELFNAADRARGYFSFLNHAGEQVEVPLTELSFDVVDNLPDEEIE
ncbi:MAG: response regulator [Chloroflexi bacterium]|nr:response regulator [Chloroflexota bacterium]